MKTDDLSDVLSLQYIRNEAGHPVGCMAAVRTRHGGYALGASYCSPKDQFVRRTARNKAIGRARSNALRGTIHHQHVWPPEFVAVESWETMHRVKQAAEEQMP